MSKKMRTAVKRFFSGSSLKRLMKTLVVVVLAAAVVAVISILAVKTDSPINQNVTQSKSKSETPLCFRGISLNIVAHQDDDLLFMNPDIQQDINNNRCVYTVYTTSGDRDEGIFFVHNREEGVMSAYSLMAGRANSWYSSQVTFNNHPILVERLNSDPKITLIFMRLPTSDGRDGGYENYGGQTLRKLQLGQIKQVKAADGSANYNASDLVATLEAIMNKVRPDTIRIQDYTRPYDNTPLDHSDHVATARFALAANSKLSFKHLLIGYEDYPISELPSNLAPDQVQTKEKIWLSYAAHDMWVCKTIKACQDDTQDGYFQWFSREYSIGTIPHQYYTGAPSGIQGGSL